MCLRFFSVAWWIKINNEEIKELPNTQLKEGESFPETYGFMMIILSSILAIKINAACKVTQNTFGKYVYLRPFMSVINSLVLDEVTMDMEQCTPKFSISSKEFLLSNICARKCKFYNIFCLLALRNHHCTLVNFGLLTNELQNSCKVLEINIWFSFGFQADMDGLLFRFLYMHEVCVCTCVRASMCAQSHNILVRWSRYWKSCFL